MNERLIHRLLVLLAVITAAGFVVATISEGLLYGLAWVAVTYIGAGLGIGIVALIRRIA